MFDPTDSFEIALAIDAAVLAYERRTAGHNGHRPVDAKLLITIADALDLSTLPAEPPYERITALQKLVDALPEPKRAELVKLLEEDRRRVPWRAMRGSQCTAFELASVVDVLLLAGGAASGKTEVAIAVAMFQSRAARFVRKTSLEFQAIMKRVGEIKGDLEGRNLASQNWTLSAPFGFDQRGATLEFSSMNDPDSMHRLQGRPVDCLVVDDVGSGQISKEEIQFVSRWLRTAESVHKKLILPSNPPSNNDATWLRDEWFRPWLDDGYEGEHAESGEIRYFLPNPKGDGDYEVPVGTPGAQSRAVVLSSVFDNPRLVRTNYHQHLAQTPSIVLRKRLLENDWQAGFDTDADLQVIPSEWLDAAMSRWTPEPPAGAELTTVGVDVARGGRDRSAIISRYGDWFSSAIVRPGSQTPDGASLGALVVEQLRGSYDASVYPDATGVGAALVDYLRSVGVHVVPIVFAGKYEALDRTRSFGFLNVRSALWWRLREALDPANGRQIALPPDRALRAELVAPRYELRAGGKIYVESRADVVKRCGRSPDVATAVILALIEPTSNIGRGNVWAWRFEMQRRQERMASDA